MDENIKNSIKARYDAFNTAYDLTEDIRKEVDELFDKIYEFGSKCKDVIDFESKFASSTLNQEYINIFTKISQKCKVKEIKCHESDGADKSTGEKILKDIGSDAKYLADDLTMPARRKAREKMDSKLRDTPLGKIEQANNTFWLLKKINGKIKFKKNDVENISNDED